MSKLYHYTILRIMPDFVRGEFFNYAVIILDKNNPQDFMMRINKSPAIMLGFVNKYPVMQALYEGIMHNEIEVWKDDLSRLKFHEIERKTGIYRGINQARTFLPYLVTNNKTLCDAADKLAKLFID